MPVTFKKIVNKTRFSFTTLVVLLYFVVGFLFLFTEVWSDLLPNARNTIGIVLVLFGALRFYIAYKRYASKNQKIVELSMNKDESKNME